MLITKNIEEKYLTLRFINFSTQPSPHSPSCQQPLIYGPNSIRKSSVIHSVAYFNNLYKTVSFSPAEVKIGNTIDLGGFENFVHKTNIDNELDKLRTGKLTYEQRKELLDLSYNDLYEIFKYQIELFSKDYSYKLNCSDSYLIQWFWECMTDLDMNNFDESIVKVHTSVEPSFTAKSNYRVTIPAYRTVEKTCNQPLGTMKFFSPLHLKKQKNY